MPHTRKYLVQGDRYRLRYMRASRKHQQVVVATWDDEQMHFFTGRGSERQITPMEGLAAVAEFQSCGESVRWFPWACWYRGIHQPKAETLPWVHPYAWRRAS